MTYPVGEDHLGASLAVSVHLHRHHAAQRGLKRDVAGRHPLGGANLAHHAAGEQETQTAFSALSTGQRR